VKLLVVNSFEFAACGSRQKHALAHWLREMRDAHNLRVVVYSIEREEPRVGALYGLSYTASSMSVVGSWRFEELNVELNATEKAVRYADAVEQIDNEIRQKKAEESRKAEAIKQEATTQAVASTAKKPTGMTMPRRELQSKLNLVPSSELLQSLKTNDLAPVGARSASIIEPMALEEDYAIAA
jgi:hypothetical protein